MANTLDNLDVRVYVDYPQERKNRLGPFIFATDGTSLDDSTKVNCYIDPVTASVFGLPLPMTPEWKTTFTGKYARIQKADLTFSSPSSSTDWYNFDYRGTGDTFFICGSSDNSKMSASVKITSGLKRNEALFFSYGKSDKKDTNSQYLFKLYWKATHFPIYDTILMFRSDGGCDVYRGYHTKSTLITFSTSTTTVTGTGTLFNDNTATGDKLKVGSKIYTQFGEYVGEVASIASNTSLTLTAAPKFSDVDNWFATNTNDDSVFIKQVKSYTRSEQNYNANRTIQTSASPNNEFNDVYLIPCRGKDLLVLTSNGLNFCHTFDDLDQPYTPKSTMLSYGQRTSGNLSIEPAVILPTGDFSVVIATGKMPFQIAKLNFLNNWSVKSKPIKIETGIYPNSGLPIAIGIDNTYIGNCKYSTNATKSKQITRQGGTSFPTSVIANSRIYGKFPANEGGTQYGAFLLGTYASSTTDTITLNATSEYFNNYYNSFYIGILGKKSGTITCSSTSKTITGSGTTFTTAVSINDWLFDNDDRLIGQVKSITSNTSLELYDYPFFTITTGVDYWINLPDYYYLDFKNANGEIIAPINATLNDLDQTIEINLVDEYGRYGNHSSKGPYAPTNERRLEIKCKNNVNTGSTYASPVAFMFYSGDFGLFPKNEKLNNTQIDITSAIESLALQRYEDGGMEVSFTARKKTLSDQTVTKPEILGNRSIKVTLKPRSVAYNEVTIFEGYLEAPDITYIQGINFDNYSLLSFKGYDKKKALYSVFFGSAPSFEDSYGLIDLASLFNYTALYGGFNNNDRFLNFNTNAYGSKTFEYSFDINRNNSSGQYSTLKVPQIGDSVGSFMEKTRNDILNNFTLFSKYNWNYNLFKQSYSNTPSLNLIPNNLKRQSAVMNLFFNETDANNLGNIPIEKAYKRTIRSLKRNYQSPEANKITVIGIDKNNNNRILRTLINTDNSNPYLPVANRSNDWVGETKEFVFQNPDYVGVRTVENAANQFYERLSNGRELVEFTSDFLTYLDDTTKSLNGEFYLDGQIKYNTAQNTVDGFDLTRFKTQLSNNDKIYAVSQGSPQTVTYVGQVQSITDDDTVVLTANAANTGNSSYWTNKILDGTISTLNYSTTVTGMGTNFTTQFAVNDKIYVATTGELIGTVSSITNNTTLVLTSNANISANNVYYSKYKAYKYLDEFNIVDKSDVVKFLTYDTLNNYKILSWSVDFVKDYTNATADEVIIRNCTYLAEKAVLSTTPTVASYALKNDDYASITNVVVGTKFTIGPLVYFSDTNFKTVTAELISPPSGASLTQTTSDKETIVTSIEYTPDAAQENQIITLTLRITPEGGTAQDYYYKVRVFSSL